MARPCPATAPTAPPATTRPCTAAADSRASARPAPGRAEPRARRARAGARPRCRGPGHRAGPRPREAAPPPRPRRARPLLSGTRGTTDTGTAACPSPASAARGPPTSRSPGRSCAPPPPPSTAVATPSTVLTTQILPQRRSRWPRPRPSRCGPQSTTTTLRARTSCGW